MSSYPNTLPNLPNAQKAFQAINVIWDNSTNDFRILQSSDLGVNVSGLSLSVSVKGGLTNQSYSLVTPNVSVMVLGANANRNFLLIQNNLTGSISIGLSAAATPPQGLNALILCSGDSMAFQSTYVFTGTVSCLPLGGITGNLFIQEG